VQAGNEREPSLSSDKRIALARQALREFHAQCFWYLREDMDVTQADLPEIVHGLRQNGGRRGFLLAAQLCR